MVPIPIVRQLHDIQALNSTLGKTFMGLRRMLLEAKISRLGAQFA
jgi:hypothetical protein